MKTKTENVRKIFADVAYFICIYKNVEVPFFLFYPDNNLEAEILIEAIVYIETFKPTIPNLKLKIIYPFFNGLFEVTYYLNYTPFSIFYDFIFTLYILKK